MASTADEDGDGGLARARAAASAALLEAARSCKTKRALKAIQLADDLNVANDDGWTALHFASFNGDVLLTESLLLGPVPEEGDADAPETAVAVTDDDEPIEPIGSAAKAYLVAKALRDDHADPDLYDSAVLTNTPLHWACAKGHTTVVWRLLAAGYSLTDIDVLGNTPLHLAAANSHPRTVELLRDAGAALNVANRFKMTPLMLATDAAVRRTLTSASAADDADQGLERGRTRTMSMTAEHAGGAGSLGTQMAALKAAEEALEAAMALVPTDSAGEDAAVAAVEAAVAQCVATGGVSEPPLVRARARTKRLTRQSLIRTLVAEALAAEPVTTQRVYTAKVIGLLVWLP